MNLLFIYSHSVYRTEKLDRSQARSLRSLQDAANEDDEDEASSDIDFWDTPAEGREVLCDLRAFIDVNGSNAHVLDQYHGRGKGREAAEEIRQIQGHQDQEKSQGPWKVRGDFTYLATQF